MSRVTVGRGHGELISYMRHSRIVFYTEDDWTGDPDLAYNFRDVMNALRCVQDMWYPTHKLEDISQELKKQRVKSKVFKPVQGRFIQIDGVDVFPSRKSIRDIQGVMNIMDS